MKTFYLLLLLFPAFLLAQVNDDFKDGDFTQNPAWTGLQEKFIINSSSQLQLYDTAASSAYLLTGNSMVSDVEWRCWVKLSFSPSANNNARIYLVSDQADLNLPLNGYFVQLGESGSVDAIELFKQDGENLTSICRGTEGMIASSFTIRLKVKRTTEGFWQVFVDPNGGENFQLEAEGTDDSFSSTSYFGFYCLYTSSNSTKMYFDDVYVGPEIIDTEPPEILAVSVLSDSTLLLGFSEPLDQISAETTTNYVVDQGIGIPNNAELNQSNSSEVMISFSNHFETESNYTLSVSNVQDLAGNEMLTQEIGFLYYQPKAFDVVINEIMADPSPEVGLPDHEFLELYNQTNNTIDLTDWMLTIGSSEKIFGPAQILPNGYLIVAHEDAETDLSAYGSFYGFSSFSLTNTGQTITLTDKEGNTISMVSYQDDWYKDPDKEDGGWTLEQINPNNICSQGDNWQASEDSKGGTPGAINSVYSNIVLTPKVDRIEMVADNLLRLYFNQAMDATSMTDVVHYIVDHDIGNPQETFSIEGQPGTIELYFGQTFLSGVIYQLTVLNTVANCIGQHPENDTTISFGLGDDAVENDIIINEILFNPWTNGVDYVEIYNRSDKVIDLSLLQIGTVKTSPPNPPDTLHYTISDQQMLLVPGVYLLLSSSPETVKSQYLTENPNGFLKVEPFPAYNNDEGTCLLINQKQVLIDAFDYSEDMQYPLLNYVDGVSLERASFDNPTNDKNNWHSAAEAVGFGTPAYQNSQFIKEGGFVEEITIEPEIFSPDNDGYNDVVSINYTFDQPGYMMTANVFNSGGNLVRKLVNNQYLGTEGAVNWDGIQDDNTKASVGIYIFFIQVFDLNGNVKKYKKTTVLASKL